jgi:hypothetical protein
MIKHLIDQIKEYIILEVKYYENNYITEKCYKAIPLGHTLLKVTSVGKYDIVIFNNIALCFCGDKIN